jgi:hypothetical protein
MGSFMAVVFFRLLKQYGTGCGFRAIPLNVKREPAEGISQAEASSVSYEA